MEEIEYEVRGARMRFSCHGVGEMVLFALQEELCGTGLCFVLIKQIWTKISREHWRSNRMSSLGCEMRQCGRYLIRHGQKKITEPVTDI